MLEVEASYGHATKPPPKHLHPDQDERFEVLSGELRVRHGENEVTLGPGETIEIPRGTAHQMWSTAGETLATLLTEYDDVFRLAVGSDRLVRGALAPLAALGRARGYG